MLEQLEQMPADPILGLAAACRADANPDKVDLTVGIYMDEQGLCPVSLQYLGVTRDAAWAPPGIGRRFGEEGPPPRRGDRGGGRPRPVSCYDDRLLDGGQERH